MPNVMLSIRGPAGASIQSRRELVRALVPTLAANKVGWSAPRIQGALLKLGLS